MVGEFDNFVLFLMSYGFMQCEHVSYIDNIVLVSMRFGLVLV